MNICLVILYYKNTRKVFVDLLKSWNIQQPRKYISLSFSFRFRSVSKPWRNVSSVLIANSEQLTVWALSQKTYLQRVEEWFPQYWYQSCKLWHSEWSFKETTIYVYLYIYYHDVHLSVHLYVPICTLICTYLYT